MIHKDLNPSLEDAEPCALDPLGYSARLGQESKPEGPVQGGARGARARACVCARERAHDRAQGREDLERWREESRRRGWAAGQGSGGGARLGRRSLV